jgi:hypothetical protein
VDRLRLDVRRTSVGVGVVKEMAVLYPAMSLSGHEPGKLLPSRRCEPMLTQCRSRACVDRVPAEGDARGACRPRATASMLLAGFFANDVRAAQPIVPRRG